MLLGKLILQHGKEHSPSVVKRCLAVMETTVAHGPHVQIFHTDDLVRVGYPPRFFVQMILPAVPDLLVNL